MNDTNDRDKGDQGGNPLVRDSNLAPAEHPVDEKRRRVCQIALGGTAAVSAAALGYPVVTFLRLPKALGPVELMEVPLDELVEGYGYWGQHRGRQIVVINLGDEIRAFDGICTHLGCIVRWNSASRMFECPCHGGKFDDLGNPVSGPVNAPLRRVEFVVEGNLLKIRDFLGQA